MARQTRAAATRTMAMALLALLALLAGCGSAATGDEAHTSAGGSGVDKGQDQTTGGGGADAGGFADTGGASSTPGAPGKGSSDQSSGGQSGSPAGEGGAPWSPPAGGADAGSASDVAANSDAGGDAAKATCDEAKGKTLYLSADDSNSMASATIARGLIGQGQVVFKPVRTYELLNYYDFAYTAAKAGEIAVSAQLRQTDKGAFALQIGVRAPDFDAATRRRFDLVLAVDTSASMGWGPSGQQGIDLARAACKALVAGIDVGDRLTILAWGASVATLLPTTQLEAKDDGTLAKACDGLAIGGDTGLSAGLQAAYKAAKAFPAADRIRRVILLSDGGANVGETDAKLIAAAAKAGDADAVYLMGVGVGDPWNYNDTLMNAVTDAGKGAYVFLDSSLEAWNVFGPALLRHLEVAAREVQVELKLPPTLDIDAFHGEQISTVKEEVEPQHLAANDAMISHQTLVSCAPDKLTGAELIEVTATSKHPTTGAAQTATFKATLSELLGGDGLLLHKGDAVVAFAEALQDVMALDGAKAQARIDVALAALGQSSSKLPGDADLQELIALLSEYRKVFDAAATDPWPKGGTGADPIVSDCSACKATGDTTAALACALDLCDPKVVLGHSYSSPTQSKTEGTFAAVTHFGDQGNHLAPQVGGSYALMATGPALGTAHSVDVGGVAMVDPFVQGGASVHNAMEYTLKLRAPAGANGIRMRYVFFSQEYDEYVGSTFNDKFYVVLRAGSTNGGKPTVINATECRNPAQHYDFVCSPGMQFCQPRQRYCYIAINTSASECCWLGGCPKGKAKTDISGTGFSCAANQSGDSADKGSSTGWMMTEWPIEPGEVFEITFHIHDTGDGVYDSEVLLDGLQFVGTVTPGTWPLQLAL